MAFLYCPFGYPDDFKEKKHPYRSRVDIIIGICASPDRCGIKKCPFYDRSKEATSIFCQTQAHEDTFEGKFKTPRIKWIDEEIHNLLLDVYGIERRFDGMHSKAIPNPEYFEDKNR